MIDIIFLDIDGVLNSHGSAIFWNRHGKSNGGFSRHNDAERAWCPISCSNLLFLLEERPDIRIVVSSTWRQGETIASMADILWECAKIPKEKVIGLTPVFHDNPRGNEINAWLNKYGREKVRRFVILDDDTDMANLKNFLVKTDAMDGLTQSKIFETFDRFDFPWKSAAPIQVWDRLEHELFTGRGYFVETVYDEKLDMTTTYWSYKNGDLIAKLERSPQGGRKGRIHRMFMRVNSPDMKTK